MRCPNCNKFVAYDDGTEPEHNLDMNVEVSEATVSGDVRIVLTCADCAQELKEYSFDIDETFNVKSHDYIPEGHPEGADALPCPGAYTIDVSDIQLTSRSDCGTNKRTGKPNPYKARYATTYYGFSLTVSVTCECGHEETFDFSDETAASGMDELV